MSLTRQSILLDMNKYSVNPTGELQVRVSRSVAHRPHSSTLLQLKDEGKGSHAPGVRFKKCPDRRGLDVLKMHKRLNTM